MQPADVQKGKSDTSRYHVPNLERAIVILEYLANQPAGCGVSEMAKELELPKNSVFRIVKTLDAYKYLVFDEERKTYSLSRKLLTLGHAAVGEENIVEKSLDIMRKLRDQTTETVLIGTIIGTQGVVLESVLGTHPVKFTIEVGYHFPLHTAAPGKAMIAFLPEEEQDGLIKRLGFKKYTPYTITSRKAFREALAQVAADGYAVDDREEQEELRCVAAPIFNHRGYPIASLWITAPAFRLEMEGVKKASQHVLAMSRKISARFGYELISR